MKLEFELEDNKIVKLRGSQGNIVAEIWGYPLDKNGKVIPGKKLGIREHWYPSSLNNALFDVLRLEILDSEAQDVKQLIRCLKKCTRKITKAVESM